MLIFLKQRLVFFAVPKTGTTALEEALRPFASIDLRDPPHLRHMNAGAYHRDVRPWLANTFDAQPETVAILRHPLERLRSWYRYRHAPVFKGTPDGVHGLSFDDFIAETLKDDPRPFGRIGSQDRFALGADDAVRIHHLFVYEQMDLALDFLDARIAKPFEMPELNVSPRAPAPLSPDLEAAVRRARAREFSLYDRVAAQGHLATPEAR